MARWLGGWVLGLCLFACDDGGEGSTHQEGPADAAAQSDSAADAMAPDDAAPDVAPAPDAAADPADAAPEDAPDAGPEPDAAAPDAAPANTITGRLYEDGDGTDESVYASAFDPAHDTPLPDLSVTLLGPDGERQTTTDAEGRYAFEALAEGTWLAAPEVPEGRRCARRNCPRRFVEAVRAGRVKIVTFGDSVPVVGDAPFFPDRLATLLSDLADVNSVNVAVAGSKSTEWVPGERHFENRLRPEAADADLVLISIGGNDLVEYAADPAHLRNIPAAVEGAHMLVARVADNILTTVRAIREINPTVDVAFCLYVNYTQSRRQQIWVLATRLLGEENIRSVLESARRLIPEDSSMMLVDLYGAATDLPLDDYLYDPLHFNDLGQTLYAEEILRALGGVHVGPSPLPHGRASFGADQTWSFLP